jgi:putative ABC transport system permease protein
LKNRELAEPTAAKLERYATQNGFEVKAWRELNDFYDKTKELYREQFGVFRLIILAMVFLGVRNAMSITVAERAGEFGTMRALGTRRLQVFRTVLVESLLLGLLGALLGAAVGVLAAFAISKIGIPMPPPPNSNIGYTAHIQLIPGLVSGAFAIGILATLLATILPAIRASRMPIADALRQAV